MTSNRTDGWIASGVVAGVCLLAGFSSPLMLLPALAAGGYAYHLYQGGRDLTGTMPDGRPRARAWLLWALLAFVAFTAFTLAGMVIAAAAGTYAGYLFSGARDVTRERPDGSPRSAVWMYWGGIAALALWFTFDDPLAPLYIAHWAAAIVFLFSAAYASYLFRGGRFVFWIGA